MLTRSLKFILFTLMLVAALTMFGCGNDGATGPAGPAGPPGEPSNPSPGLDTAAVEPETCVICHGAVDQTEHQSIYNAYKDADSTLALTIDGVASVDNGDGTFDSTVTFTITQNGAPYTDVDGLPSLDQKRFYAVTYDPATATFDNSVSFSNPVVTATAGTFTATAAAISYAPENAADGEVYGVIAKGVLETEGMELYGDVANAALTLGAGNAATYASPANVAGCEKCHGTPYRKHGYREAQVAGLGDFAACKSCHYDTRDGHDTDWQRIVSNPEGYANSDPLSAAETTTYAYQAKVMNDVHMSHSMEFPYPQNMSNCATCHEGKLNIIQADENFTAATCKSCHPVTSTVDAGGEAIHDHAAPSLQQLWEEKGVQNFTAHKNVQANCYVCHNSTDPDAIAGSASFGVLMPGYDPVIYADNTGTRYSDIFNATIDDAVFADNILTISFSVHENAPNPTAFSVTDIVPTLMVGLYGYGTKDFIYGHGDSLEGEISAGIDNPNFTIDQAPGDGTWVVKVDLSNWADQIDGVKIKRAEIIVRPALRDPALGIESRSNAPYPHALNAPSRTFDLTKNAFDDEFFGGNNANAIADVQGCNKCHDALATTFHTADRGGNVTVCRYCHVPSSGGSHLEMQSRAIDSYAHAIHSFQAFDIGDIDFTDPVQAVKYELHVEHVFPNFTIKNCEACHTADKYMVPDQSKSLSAVLSGSDTVVGLEGRNLGYVPSYVTGPAYRSCGGCHRADFIKENESGKLISLNSHAKDNGYLVENGDFEAIVETIQSLFN